MCILKSILVNFFYIFPFCCFRSFHLQLPERVGVSNRLRRHHRRRRCYCFYCFLIIFAVSTEKQILYASHLFALISFSFFVLKYRKSVCIFCIFNATNAFDLHTTFPPWIHVEYFTAKHGLSRFFPSLFISFCVYSVSIGSLVDTLWEIAMNIQTANASIFTHKIWTMQILWQARAHLFALTMCVHQTKAMLMVLCFYFFVIQVEGGLI